MKKILLFLLALFPLWVSATDFEIATPGHRPANCGPRHEVHDILDVIHGLAFWALEKPDTS